MSKQLELNLDEKKPTPSNGLPHPALAKLNRPSNSCLRIVAAGRLPQAMGTLRKAIDRIGIKHHGLAIGDCLDDFESDFHEDWLR